MTTNRARGVWAALLALLIAAQIPATALGGEAGKSFVPDPEPMPATGDPDASGGGVTFEPPVEFLLFPQLAIPPQLGVLALIVPMPRLIRGRAPASLGNLNRTTRVLDGRR